MQGDKCESSIPQMSCDLKGLWLWNHFADQSTYPAVQQVSYVEAVRLAQHRMRDSPRTGCALEIAPICMWSEEAIIKLPWGAVSIVAYCHNVKLRALAVWASDCNTDEQKRKSIRQTKISNLTLT